MSVGPMGMVGSAAGAPLAQSQGSDVNRVQQDTASQARQTQMSEKAEQASGVGQTEQDEEATDRDADGRRPWEIGPTRPDPASAEGEPTADDCVPPGQGSVRAHRQPARPSRLTVRRPDCWQAVCDASAGGRWVVRWWCEPAAKKIGLRTLHKSGTVL